MPDSLKTAFKTRNGRTVYDGFGIEPDVEVEPRYMSNIAIGLMQKFLVFDYVTEFVRTHASIPSADVFEITDEIYADFVNYLSDKELNYSTVTEKVIKELREVAKEEKYIESIQDDLDAMEKKFREEKKGDLEKNREEISEMLKSEILVRYYYEKGRLQGMLKSDPEVLKAIEILSDKTQYEKLLGK